MKGETVSMENKVEEALSFIKSTLKKADLYYHAANIINFDLETICPPKGMEEEGEIAATLANEAYKLSKSKKFIEAVNLVFDNLDQIEDEFDVEVIKNLHRNYLQNKNISPSLSKKFSLIYNKSYIDWLNAKKEGKYSLFVPSLKKVREVNYIIINLSEEENKGETPYDYLLSFYERGMTSRDLDEIFNRCKERLIPLLEKIKKSNVKIRTDFLYRYVPIEKQEKVAKYLLETMGFDFSRGVLSTTEHPFTSGVGRNDTRVTTHYYEKLFCSNIYSVVHEGGHALFDQNQPRENFDHFLENKTMGMHESVSRFYENILGRSRDFVHLVYPKIQEILGDTLIDVSEEEFYRGINLVTPSLIRTEADEFTYTFHIIIRYELEKQIVNDKISLNSLNKLWNKKYQEYLGIKPRNDTEGILQDVHWSSGFGYFPTYAMGNFYNAMYFKKMKEEIDVSSLIRENRMSEILNWMKEKVFKKADRLDSKTWIKEITSRDFTPDDFLDYLEEKYTDIYELEN